MPRTINTPNSKSATAPTAMSHHWVDVCPPVRAEVAVPTAVEVVVVALRPGDGDLAVKENLPLTG